MIKDKSMGRKLIFLDIDGTLLPPGDMLIPESTLAALDRARANGHKLFLCTGRNHRMTEPLLRHDCFAGAVCSAGGYVLCDGKTLVSLDEFKRKLFWYFQRKSKAGKIRGSVCTGYRPRRNCRGQRT